jgi:hypothetical protein
MFLILKRLKEMHLSKWIGMGLHGPNKIVTITWKKRRNAVRDQFINEQYTNKVG